MVKALGTKLVAIICLSVLSVAGCSAQKQEIVPQQFWTEFRQAVLAEDYQKLSGMTQFPLEVLGVDDSQPAEFYDKTQFEVIFKKILAQSVMVFEGDVVVSTTTREMISRTITIKPEHLMTKELFRIDQLEFELKDNRWRLVRAYLEE